MAQGVGGLAVQAWGPEFDFQCSSEEPGTAVCAVNSQQRNRAWREVGSGSSMLHLLGQVERLPRSSYERPR